MTENNAIKKTEANRPGLEIATNSMLPTPHASYKTVICAWVGTVPGIGAAERITAQYVKSRNVAEPRGSGELTVRYASSYPAASRAWQNAHTHCASSSVERRLQSLALKKAKEKRKLV